MKWIRPHKPIEVDADAVTKIIDTVLLVCLAEKSAAQWRELTENASEENEVERQVWREITKQVATMAQDEALGVYIKEDRIRVAADSQFRDLEYIAARMIPAVEKVIRSGMRSDEAFKKTIDDMIQEFDNE